MKKLLFINLWIFSTICFGQEITNRTAVHVNDQFYNSIEDMNLKYEYHGDNLSLELYQEPIDWESENWDLQEGAPSVIKINDFYFSLKLGDKNKFIVKELVMGGMPEIILYSESSCQAYCGTETYIINYYADWPFVISHIGNDKEIIEEKGVIEYYDYESETDKKHQYNFSKATDELFIYEAMKWVEDEVECYRVIESMKYSPQEGYYFDKIKWKLKTYCVACFIGDMLVSVNESEKKPISSLKVGDRVLTYDFVSKKNKTTEILEIISVPHDIFIEYHFDHDSITATLDHPFYLSNKGWSSYNPEATSSRYNNYNVVGKIAVGDVFIQANGNKTRLNSYTIIEERRPSYTITKLSEGNCFYVNDILVGVESFDQHCFIK